VVYLTTRYKLYQNNHYHLELLMERSSPGMKSGYQYSSGQ